jgi:hypothetical protein
MRWRSGKFAAVAVTLTVTVAACAQTVDGTARRAHPGAPDPERSFGYVDDRCGLLQDSTVQDTLHAESVVRPYSGAVCQYVLVRQDGLIDVVFSWFETGTLDRERDLATERGARVEDADIERHPAFTATTEDNPAACAATAAAGTGVLTWWVQYRPAAGGDACDDAATLLAATLSSDM